MKSKVKIYKNSYIAHVIFCFLEIKYIARIPILETKFVNDSLYL